jgi:uncharacterized protein
VTGMKERIADDLKAAMRERDPVRTETLRSVRSAVLNREVELGSEVDDAEITKLIRALVKQRSDSIEHYEAGGRTDLVDRESAERAILEAYLPQAIDPAVIDSLVQGVVAELGASSMKDMGRVMKEALSRLGPSADGKLVSAAVKKALS